MSPERPSAGCEKTAVLTPLLSSCKQSPATTVSTGWKRKSPRSQRRPPAWSSSSNTRATTEPHPARATRLAHHLTEGLWPVAYAPLNVGGANDVATLRLDARPSGSTSSDGVASAKRTATGKLLTPVASIRRATGGRNTTGLIGKCPTTTILMSGHEVAALLDIASEVTTVTETWAAAHLQDRSLQQAFLTLRAVNGAEVPYSGILLVDIDILGKRCPDVPVLVVKEPTELSMQQRKRRLPVLVGMNVLRSCFPPEPALASEVPSCLQAVVREVRLQQRTTTQGVARTTSRCHIPANSMTTIRVTGRQKPACHLLASPVAQPLPSGLLMVPTLISSDPYSRFVRVANLSDEDVLLSARTPVAVLQAIDSVDSTDIQFTVGVNELVVSRETVCRSADSAPADHVLCPDFDGTSSQRKRLQELLTKHAAGFIKDKQDLGYTEAVHHRLRTTDSIPVAQPYRRIPPHQQQEVQEHIKGLLAQNVIVESHSPYAAPVVIVGKKDGGIRLCVDYCRLNAKTVGDAYPLPRIQESFDALVGAQFFSTLDLASGYHQIAMHPDDQHKTAFVTPMGLFEYTRMPMGLSSAPATFQRLMQSTMSNFIFQFLLVYLDDLLVYSKTFDEHLAHLDRLLQRIIDAGLKLKMDKCQFLRRQVHYLGHTISAEGVSCKAGKVEAVKNWPVPATTTALRSFLGFASYYRRFIQGFSKIAGPLHDLVAKGSARHKKKGADISKLWDQQHQKAFEELKTALTTAPVLWFAEFTKPFILETDASHDGLSAILSQDQDGQRRVLAYASRRLRPTEKNQANYSSMKLEFLALKWAVTEKFRHYLLGAEFDVFTDNNPLVHFRTAPLEQRWAAQLAQFHFTVKYRPGKSNPADALSRMPPDFHPEASSSPMPPEVAVAQELACEHQPRHQRAAHQSHPVCLQPDSVNASWVTSPLVQSSHRGLPDQSHKADHNETYSNNILVSSWKMGCCIAACRTHSVALWNSSSFRVHWSLMSSHRCTTTWATKDWTAPLNSCGPESTGQACSARCGATSTLVRGVPWGGSPQPTPPLVTSSPHVLWRSSP